MSEEYVVVLKTIKCENHCSVEEKLSINYEEKKSYFKPCSGHYHTIIHGAPVLICTEEKCYNKQLKYLTKRGISDNIYLCFNPYCKNHVVQKERSHIPKPVRSLSGHGQR